MAGFSRFLDILRLFDTKRTDGAAGWSVPAMAAALAAPASTLYRTVRELTKAGFLEQAGEGQYRLGPAFIEFERLLRLNDPLVREGSGVLADLVHQADVPCIALMARLYNNEVMCVADIASAEAPFRSSYERGRPMSTTRGATSKIILAHLPSRDLTKLIGARNASAELRRELQTIRRAGYVITDSEIDHGLTGIAAPIMVPQAGVKASISIVVQDEGLEEATRRRLVLLVVSAASLLAEEIRRSFDTRPSGLAESPEA